MQHSVFRATCHHEFALPKNHPEGWREQKLCARCGSLLASRYQIDSHEFFADCRDAGLYVHTGWCANPSIEIAACSQQNNNDNACQHNRHPDLQELPLAKGVILTKPPPPLQQQQTLLLQTSVAGIVVRGLQMYEVRNAKAATAHAWQRVSISTHEIRVDHPFTITQVGHLAMRGSLRQLPICVKY